MAKPIKIKRPSDSEMCPPGYHVVRGHERICQSGFKTWVDTHNAKNPQNKATILHEENLLYLYWHGDLRRFGPLKAIKGFGDFHEIDPVIQFWLEYWKSQGLSYPKDFDPLVIKAMIAIESSFNPSAKPRGGSAHGLMQILKRTLRRLSGARDQTGYREVKDHCVSFPYDKLSDPILNIAAGTRWFAHKYTLIKPLPAKTVFNAIKWYNENNSKGDAYAKQVLALYQASL